MMVIISFLQLTSILVEDYDDAITFFTEAMGFELVEDSPAHTDDGRPKRWVVVRPPGAETGILLARADGDDQVAAIGNQHAGRVGFFRDIAGNRNRQSCSGTSPWPARCRPRPTRRLTHTFVRSPTRSNNCVSTRRCA